MPDESEVCDYKIDPDDPASWGGSDGDECYIPNELLDSTGYWRCPHKKYRDNDRCVFHMDGEPENKTREDYFLIELAKKTTTPDEDDRLNEIIGAEFSKLNLGRLSGKDSRLDSIPPLHLEHCEFNNRANLSGLSFEDDVFLNGSSFHSDLVITDGVFNGQAGFRGIDVHGLVDFSDSMFNGRMRLNYATVSGRVNLSGATFSQYCDLSGSEFDSGLDMTSIAFGARASIESLNLQGITAHGSDFKGSNLSGSDFRNANLRNCNFESALMNRISMEGIDLRGSCLFGAALGGATIDGNSQILGRPNQDNSSNYSIWNHLRAQRCVYDPLYASDDEIDAAFNIDKAKSVYKKIEVLAQQNAATSLQREAFIRRQDLRKLTHKRATISKDSIVGKSVGFVSWVKSSLSRSLMLYGESPWRVVAWSAVCIVLYSFLYINGSMITQQNPTNFTSSGNPPSSVSYIEALYYSTLIFTTLGFDVHRPIEAGRLLTTTEAALGAVLVSLLVFVLGRRAVR
ncbi:pentapeptide repeat-containing protein [Natrinema longum]|uniref:pentapeptide repeat-containing protein n=1 Tax=Natrinema longum TaxID=370324 RepID=UPI001CC9EAA5|nr:pentapeptide repeat-containing protein [Natrinema longum]MBZ6497180.1 pentapeptide repeat-containing protein [Natrinema longum]